MSENILTDLQNKVFGVMKYSDWMSVRNISNKCGASISVTSGVIYSLYYNLGLIERCVSWNNRVMYRKKYIGSCLDCNNSNKCKQYRDISRSIDHHEIISNASEIYTEISRRCRLYNSGSHRFEIGDIVYTTKGCRIAGAFHNAKVIGFGNNGTCNTVKVIKENGRVVNCLEHNLRLEENKE